MKEIWKDIKNYEGLYQVSNLGRIKSLNYNNSQKEKILKTGQANGYLNISLSKNGKATTKSVHRIVAENFIPKLKENQNIVNHKDGDKSNNVVDNLEWCTQKENIMHSWSNGLSKSNEKQKQAVKESSKKINRYGRKIIQCDLNGNVVKEWYSAREIRRQLGISSTTLFKACTGIRKSACGYIWKYGENEKRIIQYDLNENQIKTWKRVKDIEKKLLINETGIYKCCTGKQKTAGGYIWRYSTTSG